MGEVTESFMVRACHALEAGDRVGAFLRANRAAWRAAVANALGELPVDAYDAANRRAWERFRVMYRRGQAPE